MSHSNSTSALTLVLGASEASQALSPAARSFNFQLSRVEKLKSQLAELESLQLQFLPLFDAKLRPLRARQLQGLRKVVIWIDQRLQHKGLGKVQREIAIDLLCSMAEQLAQSHMPDMAALHDKYSKVTLAEMEQAEIAFLKTMMRETSDDAQGEEPEFASVEDYLKARADAMRQRHEQRMQEQLEAKEKKKAKKKKSPSALKAEQMAQDASGLLRQLFRQLASSLHPDREKDETLRLKKTALMSEANAAYDRKDLVALMHLQIQAALVEPGGAQQLADEKLIAMTLLLKQQVAELERERAQKQATFLHELNLPPGLRTTQVEVARYLQDLEMDLLEACESLENDLKNWDRNDMAFRGWLYTQR